ncbi:hypothetical protein BDZ94DRAFT_1248648 [Collybia nuda]|uniref:DUF6533 domain-containing protein n=1 Tax=Collybia nuda TaxID=64659 RepID=A0A9P5YEZ3_9AGAR|nr:hypothetical protein BDZ94DRAFT_1248648 [Collybia nuda]
MYLLKCLTYSSLAFHIWEWLSNFSFEIRHIWRLRKSSIVKWQYLWSRYLGMAAQIADTIATRYIHSHYIVPRTFCVGWYLVQLIISQGLLASLEISLVMRLYALSDSSNRLRVGLFTLVAVENIIVMVGGVLSILEVELEAACLPREPTIHIIIISVTLGVTQMILWGLTIQHSWRKKVALTSLVMRDGSWVFAVVSIILVGTNANTFARTRTHKPVVNPFSTFVAAMASLNCRIIVNLEGMSRKRANATSMFELTSFVDTEFVDPPDVFPDQPNYPSRETEITAVENY